MDTGDLDEAEALVFTLDTEEIKRQIEIFFENSRGHKPVAAPLADSSQEKSNIVDFSPKGDLQNNVDAKSFQRDNGFLEVNTGTKQKPYDEMFIELCKKYERFSRIILQNPIRRHPVSTRSYDAYYTMDMILKKCGTLNPLTDMEEIQDLVNKDPELWMAMGALYGNIDVALGLKDPDRIFRTVRFVAQKLSPAILKTDRIEGGLQSRFRKTIDVALDYWADCCFQNYLVYQESQGFDPLVPNYKSIAEKFEREDRMPLLRDYGWGFERKGIIFPSAHVGVYNEIRKEIEIKRARLFYRNFQNTHNRLLGLYAFLEDQLKRI